MSGRKARERFGRSLAIGLILLALGSWASTAAAVIYTVGPSGTYPTIQAAIDAAVDGGTTEIRIERLQVYNENLVVSGSFDNEVLILSGGWYNNFTEQDTNSGNTVVDGGGSRVLAVLLAGTSLTVNGLTLTNGSAANGGGAWILPAGDAVISFQNVRICCNVATSPSGIPEGGGLRAEIDGSQRLELIDTRLRANQVISTGGIQARGGGACIYARGNSTLLIEGSEIDENEIDSDGGPLTGGGLYVWLSENAGAEVRRSFPISNTIYSDNAEGSGAHFKVEDSSSLTIERSAFALNEMGAGAAGEQLRVQVSETASVQIRDSGVAQGAKNGLTLAAYDFSTVNLTNLTVADHGANGINAYQFNSATVTLYNSIAFNSGLSDLSLLGTVDTGSNLIGIDPLFVDSANIDYHLRPGSPALDAGDNSPPGGLGATDIDGNPRVLNGTVDIGMYEGATFVVFADDFESGDMSAWSSSTP